jgi:hypothetical protein
MRTWHRYVGLAVLAAVLASGRPAAAQFNVGLSTGYSEAYLFRGFKLADSGGVGTASAGYTWKNGLSLQGSTWNWVSFAKDQKAATTLDTHLSYSTKKLPVSVTGGYIYYGGQLGGHIQEFYGQVASTTLPGGPALVVYHGWRAPVHTVAIASAGNAWPLGKQWTYTTWGAVGFNEGKTYAPDGFAVAIWGNNVSYPLTKDLKVTAAVDTHLPNHLYDRSFRVVPSLNVGYSGSF